MEITYELPQEVINAFVRLGYESDDIKDVKNIDVGFQQLDMVTGKRYVTYALYTDEDVNSDDTIEFTIALGEYWIEQNGDTVARGECKSYLFNQDTEEPIGALYQVD